jgi:hypothetical protein
MSIVQPTASKNIVLGAGYIFFDPVDSDGKSTGERYVAETPGFSLTLSTERMEAWSSDGPIAEKLEDITTKVTRDFKVSARDISAENLALFLIANAGTETTSGATVTDEAINGGQGITQGRWYQIGASASHPAGKRNISTLVIKDSVPTTYVKGTDYIEDLALGRIQIIVGGGIADDTVITADYKEATGSWEQITSNDIGAKEGALRYIADNTTGTNRDVYIPKCRMNPDGEFAMKSRDTLQELSFTISVLKKAGLAQAYINGRAA